MFRPSLKNNNYLIALAVLALVLYYFTQSSYRVLTAQWHEEKQTAAHLMDTATQIIKDELYNQGYTIDKVNDPNETGLIGASVSSITTSRGNLSERLVTTNPNFAAAMVDLLKKANLEAGDYVAVGLTGANPGANLALFSAMETLKLRPIIITSVGSATYGANRENLTWLDMERVLEENGVSSFVSAFATIGGTNDLGRGLPPEGRENIIAAIDRNQSELIGGETLDENIELRIQAYNALLPEGRSYRAFINIGAGVGNVGSLVNAKLIHTGINRRLGERSFKEPGAMMHFAQGNIPVIHIYNINKIVSDYRLPNDIVPQPKPGEGSLFSTRINNVYIASLCWFILVAAIIAVIAFDRHDRKFMSNVIDPDEEL
ncbi:MAG: poly-gamma-glutamate system protein [Candidatus Cloacimonetes bacterium]|nr:poly-gamma-glutamate system protein [Candidatus Cloacimonadota bacterium]